MSEDRPPIQDDASVAPPAQLSRGTLVGCLGIFCVLLTLPLLWLAVGAGAGWLSHVLPLFAFAAAVGGAALTLRVPASLTVRSSDPQRPLTHTGSVPTVERPASRTNRLAWLLAVVLIAGVLGGYTLEVLYPGTPSGVTLMIVAGAILVSQGALVSNGRLPAPALHWLRLSIYGVTRWHGAALIAIGFVAIGGALFLALLDGYAWALIGLTLLIAALALMTPLARRLPGARRPE